MEDTPVFVLGMGANGLGVVRSLGMKGVPVFSLDPRNNSEPSLYSRYCKKIECINNEDEIIKTLILKAKKISKKCVLLIASDIYVLLVSKRREDLEPYFYLTLPSTEVVETVIDKLKTYQKLSGLDVDQPKTIAINSEDEIEKHSKEITFPCAIKPRLSHVWRKVYPDKKLIVVNSKKELFDTFRQIQSKNLTVILQEIIVGKDADSYQFFFYRNRGGEILGSFVYQRLRLNPINFGVVCAGIGIENKQIDKIAEEILCKLDYQGIGAVEFKKDERDSKIKFVEINGRTVLAGWLATCSGMNIPYIAYSDILGRKWRRSAKIQYGKKWFAFLLDYESYRNYRKHGEITFVKWIKSYFGKKVYAYFNWYDPSPFFISFFQLLLKKFKIKA